VVGNVCKQVDSGEAPAILKYYFSTGLYRERKLVERFFSKLKHSRTVATRYYKIPENFLATIQLASIRFWLRAYELGR
jgi:transposase